MHTAIKMNLIGGMYVLMYVYAKIITRGYQFQRGGEAWKEVEEETSQSLKGEQGRWK